MKILYCIDHLRPDGAQRALAQLVEGLAARGHKQAILCLNDSWDEALVDRLQKAPADVRIVGKFPLACGYGLVSTWRWIRREHSDAVVTLLFVSDVIGRTLAKAAGVPRIVSSLRARNTNYAGWQRRLVRQTMRWADAVVLNSVHIRDFAIAEEGAPPERIYVIPNGIPCADYTAPSNRTALRAELGLPADGLLIGSVGRLTHQKGFDVLLQALALVSRQDVHLLLIGTGEERSNLQAQAAALGIERRAHLAGYRRDVRHLLGALDLYVQPSRFEGMPHALLEAMAAGCPIVASAVDGNRELIAESTHGWLVPPEDARALAEAIQTALDDHAEAQRRAAAARQRASAEFSVEAMVAAWEQVLTGGK